MPIYLNESEFGAATDLIGFPHLLVCMGFVALTNNRMFGMHSDVRADSSMLAMELYQFMAGRGVDGNDIVALYGCGNWRKRYGSGNARLQWEAEMRDVAGVFGFHGPGCGFDTAIIAPQDGTYVEFVPRYNQDKCRIFYKRNEKMTYQTTYHRPNSGTFNPDIKKVGSRGVIDVSVETIAGTMNRTWSNRGNLHEVDYGARLVTFMI